MQELEDDLFTSVRCSQASTQELSQAFPSQDVQITEELASDIPLVSKVLVNTRRRVDFR